MFMVWHVLSMKHMVFKVAYAYAADHLRQPATVKLSINQVEGFDKDPVFIETLIKFGKNTSMILQ